MPLGPWPNFKACVAAVSSWADEPEAFCGWLETQDSTRIDDVVRHDATAEALAVGARHLSKCPNCGAPIPVLTRDGGSFAPHGPKDQLCLGSGKKCSGCQALRSDGVKRVFRIDESGGTLAAPIRMSNGFVKVEGRISRVGLQEYEDSGGGSHMELRLPEDVFDPKSLESFKMMPVTNTHPPVLLDSRNAATFAKGHLGEDVRKLDDTWVGAPLLITDAQAIEYMERGRNQLSNGYTCELDPTQDAALTAKWGAYKYIQRNIRGNHVALVDAARAGPDARVRLDSSGNAHVGCPRVDEPPPQEERTPMKIRIDGLDLDLTDGNANAIQTAFDKALTAAGTRSDEKVTTQTARADKAERTLKIVKDNAAKLIGRLSRARIVIDAMKAKMVPCDECNGTGKVPAKDDDAKMVSCDMCDGEGEYRMHMPVSGATGKEEGQSDDHDIGESEEEEEAEEMDVDELEVEQETENEAGKAHSDAKKRRADARKKRVDAYKEFAEKRQASFQRRVDRAIKARVALVDGARKFLGADVDMSKMDAAAIKRAVILKLNPQAKLDGKTADQLDARYDAAIEGAGGHASDRARAGTFAAPVVQNDGKPKGRDAMIAANRDAAAKFNERK